MMKNQLRWNIGGIVIFYWLWMIPFPGQTQLRPDRPTFFEEGYRRMEQEIQRLEQPPRESKEGLLTIETDQLRWQRFLSREGGFSIWIPTGISTTEKKSVATADGTLTFEVLSSNQPNSRFIVAYGTVTADLSTEQVESLFNQIRDSIIGDSAFTVSSERPLSLQQFPGKRVILKNAEEQIILQMYGIGDRIYLLGVSQQQSVDLSSAANQFFDSFRVLP